MVRRKINPSPDLGFKLIFLFPQIHRPLKANFARRLELLSERCSGYIFTLCSAPEKELGIGRFLLFSKRIRSSSIGRLLNGFWVQTVVPLWLLWRKSRVDAIVVYDPYASGLAGVILKMFLRARLIVEINGDYHRLEPSKNVFKKWLMRCSYHLTIRCCDAVKVLNRDQENFFSRHYPAKRVYRFPDYVASDYFRSLDSYQGDYLLSIGYPFELKGVDVLIRAFRKVSVNHPRIKLKIMGYCPDGDLTWYKGLAQDDVRIEFLRAGWIEDVGEQMRGCYALVNAARSEAMGKVHLEAMACKKPVVATRTNGGRECVQEGRTGLLCEIDDVDDLAKSLDQLISNPKLAVQMGEAGFERLEKEFSEEQHVHSFLVMVKEVVQEKTVLIKPQANDHLRRRTVERTEKPKSQDETYEETPLR